jgi:predicted MFS family arabinose efflux permease
MLLLNLYLKELGYVEGAIGQVNSARSVGMTLMAIPAGIVMARIRIKPPLIAAVILFSIFSVGLSTFTEFGWIMAFGVLSGLVFAIFRVASGPFFMRNSTPRERTHLFSFSFAMWILAGMIGSVGSGQLVIWLGDLTGNTILGYRYTMYIGIAVSLLALIPYAKIRSARPTGEERQIDFSRERLKKRWPFYTKVFTVNYLIGTGAGISIPFLNLYFRDRFGLTADTIGFYYFWVMCSMFVGTLAGPILAQKYGLARTVVFMQLASMPFLLTLAHTYTLPLALGAFIIRGGLMNIGVPITTNLAMELADDREHGFVQALLMLSWTSSWMVSTFVGGYLIERFGFTVTLNLTVIMYLLSTLVFFIFFGRVERRNGDQTGWYIPESAKSHV